jgi:CRP-like cAMP-binding protein
MTPHDSSWAQLHGVRRVLPLPYSAPSLRFDEPAHKSEENRILLALSDEQRAQVAPDLESVCLQAKQVLAAAEEPARYVYFPRDAVLSLLVPMEDGTAVEGAILGNEGVAGLQVFLGEGAAMEEIVVQVPGEAARMRANDFRIAMASSWELQVLLLRYSLAFMRQLARTAGCNGLHSVEERAARWLLMCRDRAGRDTFPLTHECLASLLGVRRASVSAAAEAFQSAGVIGYRRGTITIRDVERLEAASCEDYLLCRAGYDHVYA